MGCDEVIVDGGRGCDFISKLTRPEGINIRSYDQIADGA
jgi:hypothetical protein